MLIDILFADIGSTKTMVTGYSDTELGRPKFRGQGIATTTVKEGDVCLGLEKAISDFKKKLSVTNLKWKTMLASCSAAGGLRMAAHGLVKSLTSKAAKEASLGAGAILVSNTFGVLSDQKVNEIIRSSPKILLMAGGVDGGEEAIVLENVKKLVFSDVNFYVIYAGNNSICNEVKKIFASSKVPFYISENVYPSLNKFNINPARNLIHDIFETHLTDSPGMDKIKRIVDGPILPTPGAVMRASQILADYIGDLVCIDVGGATTDIHSVTQGSSTNRELQLTQEPFAKRTVEGDLGIYLNAQQVLNFYLNSNELTKSINVEVPNSLPLFAKNESDLSFLRSMTTVAISIGLKRHTGKKKKILTYKGKEEVIEGKDLTAIRWVIGTGGGLTRLGEGVNILSNAFNLVPSDLLLPRKNIQFIVDNHYIMAAAGLMSLNCPITALKMMRDSLQIPKRIYENKTRNLACST